MLPAFTYGVNRDKAERRQNQHQIKYLEVLNGSAYIINLVGAFLQVKRGEKTLKFDPSTQRIPAS